MSAPIGDLLERTVSPSLWSLYALMLKSPLSKEAVTPCGCLLKMIPHCGQELSSQFRLLRSLAQYCG